MSTIQFSPIPYSAPDLNAPGRGAGQWHNQNTVNIPVEGTNTQRLDAYFRSPLTWAKIEKAKNQYDWSPVIKILNDAISKKQKVTLGFMSIYHDDEDGVINYDNGNSAYPEYLHKEMQSEQVKDWKTNGKGPTTGDGGWVPNCNSKYYIDAQIRFNKSLNNLLETGSNAGVKYKDVIWQINVRGYGNYGEWHLGGIVELVSQVPGYPNGAHASTATLKAIIDAHTQHLPNFQLNIIMTVFDAMFLQHTKTSPEVGMYALTTSNAFGKLGWSRDNWGAGDGTGDTYIDDILIDNNRTWNGVPLNSLIMQVWKYAPIEGEPMNNTSNNFSELEAQIKKYHGNIFGNGNIDSNPNSARKGFFRAASKACGYRLQVESAEVTTTGKSVTTKLAWRNAGIAPPYIIPWEIQFDLIKSGGAVTKLGVSKFKLKGFQPAGVASVAVDTMSVDVPDGTYELRFKVVDPSGYMRPMPLYISGGSADGYSLGNISLSGGVVVPPVNKPPVVSAGPDREIKFPVKTTTLVGSVSDTDGSIPAGGINWEQTEGPVASSLVTPKEATTTVNFTMPGTYKYRITGKDNLNATAVDETTVRVLAEDVDPDPVPKTVVEVISTVVYSDGSLEKFPK